MKAAYSPPTFPLELSNKSSILHCPEGYLCTDPKKKTSDIEIDAMDACVASTQSADDYAHRGDKLGCMPLYIYRAYFKRVERPHGKDVASDIFFFEEHYVLAAQYAQKVMLHQVSVPAINGFQCPTVEQDAEQNALLKSILFSHWRCTDAQTCGSVSKFRSLLSNNAAGASAISPHQSYTFKTQRRNDPYPC